jgi:tetratricopeptide (TPR) repeat protein
MRTPIWLLILALAAPAAASDQKAGGGVAGHEPLLASAEQALLAGDMKAATQALEKAAALPGATGQVSLRLGKLAERAFQLDMAITAYTAGAAGLSGAAKGEALGRLSLVDEARGIGSPAETAAGALAADPEGAWPLIAGAHDKARQGLGNEALASAEKAKTAGGGAAATVAMGRAREALGDLGAAETAYRASLQESPGDIAASVGLARVLRRTKRAAEAEPILTRICEAAPGAVSAYMESARVKVALGRGDEAVADASIAQALAEGDPEAQRLVEELRVARALGYASQGQADMAVVELQTLRDASPESALVRLALGKAHVARRDFASAIEELRKATELQPDLAEAWFELGHAYHLGRGRPADALAPFEKAVAAAPGNSNYRAHLGGVLVDLKQYERAVPELTKATADASYESADGWTYLGAAQLQLKRYKEAIAALNEAAKRDPKSAQTEAYLAWACFGLKDAEGFKAHGGKARALGYKDATLLDYLKRIEAGEPIK